MLLLLKLNLGCCTYVDNCNTACQLSKPLLQLLPVVVGCCLCNLCPDLCNPVLDVGSSTTAVDDCGVLFLNLYCLCLSKHIQCGVLKLESQFLGDDLAACKDCDILKHCLSSVAEARSLDCNCIDCATDCVYNQCCKSLALYILCNDKKRLVGLNYFLKHWEKVLHVGDLLVKDKDERTFQNCCHVVPVCCEIWREVASVELHTFYEVDGGFDGLGLFHCDDAVLAYLVHCICNLVSDCHVVVCRNSCNLCNLALVLDGLG